MTGRESDVAPGRRGAGSEHWRETVAISGDGGALFVAIAGEAARSWRRLGNSMEAEAERMGEGDPGREVVAIYSESLLLLADRLDAAIALAPDGRTGVLDRERMVGVAEAFFCCRAAEAGWHAYQKKIREAELTPIGHA